MRVGAVEDAPRSTSLVTAKAQITLARLAGFDSIRITQVWAPGMTEPTADDVTALTNVVTAADLTGMRVFVTVMQFGSKTTPLGNDLQGQFAQFAAAVVTKVPGIEDVIVGNEPNLNRYWLPQFNADGSDAAAPAYETLLALTYDAAQGRLAGDPGLRRSRLAARRGQAGNRTGHALPHRVHQGHGSRLSRERPHRADHGRLRPARVRGQLVAPAGDAAPEHDVDLARRLRQARQAARHGVRRHRPARLDPADPLRRVRGRVADPGGEGQALHRHRAGHHEAGRRGDAGPLLQPGRSSSRSASRT